MYEVVRTVKGHDVIRRVGTRGFYLVYISDGTDFNGHGIKKYVTFRTIKSAVEFINKTF